MVGNFEAHRQAMTEILAIAKEFYRIFSKEKIRRRQAGLYEYFDSGAFQESSTNLQAAGGEFLAFAEGLKGSSPEDVKKVLAEGTFDRILEENKSAIAEVRKQFDQSSTLVSQNWDFWDAFVDFIYELRLCAYKSGSESVSAACENYIQRVSEWNVMYSSAAAEELASVVGKSFGSLNQAISRALKYGPYAEPERSS